MESYFRKKVEYILKTINDVRVIQFMLKLILKLGVNFLI